MSDIPLPYEPAAGLLEERVVLVTGAGDGVGRAVAEACGRHGATVVLLGKTIKKLESVYDAIEGVGGPQPAIYPMNLEGATAKDYQDLAETIQRELGRLDGLVNNAGWIGALTPFKQYDIGLWQRVMAINLHAPFLLTQACLPLLEQAADPAIVFSAHDCRRAYWGAYGVAKAGQDAMVDILASEYSGDRRIRVNALDTGPLRTNLRLHHYPGEDPATLPPPEAAADAYLYLIGPDSQPVSGQHFSLSGRLTP